MNASELVIILQQLIEDRGDFEMYVDIDKPTPYKRVSNAKVVMPPNQDEDEAPRIIITLDQPVEEKG